MDEYHVTAHELLGPKPLVQSEEDYVTQVRKIADMLKKHYDGGVLVGFQKCKKKAVGVVSGCLERDPTLQKVARAIDEL